MFCGGVRSGSFRTVSRGRVWRPLDAAVGCGGFCVVRPPGAGLCAAVRVGPPPEGGGCDPAGRAVRRRLLGATFRCGIAVRPMGGRRSAGRLGMRNIVFRRSIGGGFFVAVLRTCSPAGEGRRRRILRFGSGFEVCGAVCCATGRRADATAAEYVRADFAVSHRRLRNTDCGSHPPPLPGVKNIFGCGDNVLYL